MNGTAAEGKSSDQEFCGKVLSGIFTLLGLLIGFYGVIGSAIGDAGPWRDARDELMPFLAFFSVAIVVNCLLGAIAVLGLGGYLRTRLLLTLGICGLFALIGVFIVARSVQIWF